MDTITVMLTLAAITGSFFLLRSIYRGAVVRARKRAQNGRAATSVRDAARRDLVARAVRLCEMEEEVSRFAEGSQPGMPMDAAQARSERLHEETVRLRAYLEAECRRLQLPIGLVRHQRRASQYGSSSLKTIPR